MSMPTFRSYSYYLLVPLGHPLVPICYFLFILVKKLDQHTHQLSECLATFLHPPRGWKIQTHISSASGAQFPNLQTILQGRPLTHNIPITINYCHPSPQVYKKQELIYSSLHSNTEKFLPWTQNLILSPNPTQ